MRIGIRKKAKKDIEPEKPDISEESGLPGGSETPEKPKKAPKDPAARKAALRKIAGIATSVALFAVIGFLSYYLSAQYFMLKESTVAVVLATELTPNRLVAYRPSSGILDGYEVTPLSAFVEIPLASKVTLLDRSGKAVAPSSLPIDSSNVRPVSITVLPDGSVFKIKDEADLQSFEGEAAWAGDGGLTIGGKGVEFQHVLFLDGQEVASAGKDELSRAIETGDNVRALCYDNTAKVIQLLGRGGLLEVSANVPDAKVYVDGTVRGKSPCTIAVAPGDRKVSIKLAGYRSYETAATVKSGESTAVNGTLSLVTGTLVVRSDPSGAAISLNGDAQGVAPLTLPLTPGRYEVRAELEGYSAADATVSVLADKAQEMTLTLKKKPASGKAPGVSTGAVQTPNLEAFSRTAKVMVKEGNRLWLGDAFFPCEVSAAATVRVNGVLVPLSTVVPGDVVKVTGASPGDVRAVAIEERLSAASSLEVFLVSGSLVFDDAGLFRLEVPKDLKVVNAAEKTLESAADAPSGSRVRLSIDSRGKATWAEYVWRAEFSSRGRVGQMAGSSVFLMPAFEQASLGLSTQVYLKDARTSFFDVKAGDVLTLAGPEISDIQFILIEDRIEGARVLECVATAQPSKEGKVFLETALIPTGEAFPITASPSLELADLVKRKAVPVSDLSWGDRVNLYVDSRGRVLWGQVMERLDTRVSGRYLGERGGVFYFSGCVIATIEKDPVILGLFGRDELGVGSPVLAGSDKGCLRYLEARENLGTASIVSGTVVSSAKDSLSLWAGEIQTARYAKDSGVIDWSLAKDGPFSDLFPGDRVTVRMDAEGTVFWGEKTYTPPLKLEGSVLAVRDRVLTIGDSSSGATVQVAQNALVIKDGALADLASVKKGDKLKVSGTSIGSIDVVVIGR